jgi:hypothetical protein
VLPGETVMADVVAPVFQLYVPPPLAVRVVDCPLQMVLVPLMEAVGLELTVTVCVALAVQPAALVTVTV